MLIFGYIVGAIFLWTIGWLIAGSLIDDPSGDGQLAYLFIAFIWLALPYFIISELFNKKTEEKS